MFNAIQSHTEEDTKGHFISVKGISALYGPFELVKRGLEVMATDVKGNLRLFNQKYWAFTNAR